MENLKTIQKNEKFSSFAEFEEVLKKYCKETFQVLVKGDSKKLNAKSKNADDLAIVEQFVYKYIVYNCIHFGSVRKNDHKSDERKNVYSKKIKCESYVRLNFNQKLNKLEITRMELDNHTHPINKTLYAQYPQTRQPDEKKFHEMVSAVKNGATVTSTIGSNIIVWVS